MPKRSVKSRSRATALSSTSTPRRGWKLRGGVDPPLRVANFNFPFTKWKRPVLRFARGLPRGGEVDHFNGEGSTARAAHSGTDPAVGPLALRHRELGRGRDRGWEVRRL